MKTTIELAREAGFETMLRKGKILGFDRDGDYTEELKAFEALIRADESEACAKVCDDYDVKYDVCSSDTAESIAAAIRARGNA
jgi:hypothetical protein